MTIGDTVFVRWYGKIVEGMIVVNNEVDKNLASMVVVRMPVQGVRAEALFMPNHVYPTPELAAAKEHIKAVPANMPTVVPTVEASTSIAWQRLEEFKKANWDHERNHIKLCALREFYDLWKEWVAEKCGYREYPKHPYVPEFKDWNNGVKGPSIGETVASAIKEAKKAVSDAKMAELKSQLKKAIAPVEPVKKSNLDAMIEIWKKESRPRKTVKVTQLALWE